MVKQQPADRSPGWAARAVPATPEARPEPPQSLTFTPGKKPSREEARRIRQTAKKLRQPAARTFV